jgi:hypothetical protein
MYELDGAFCVGSLRCEKESGGLLLEKDRSREVREVKRVCLCTKIVFGLSSEVGGVSRSIG